MRNSFYRIRCDRFPKNIRVAIVSDLHSGDPDHVICCLREITPDYILLAGDIMEALDGRFELKNENGYRLLEACAKIAPSFYSTGNHEDGGVNSQLRKLNLGKKKQRIYSDTALGRIASYGVELLVDRYEICDGIAFGGLASAVITGKDRPNLKFLSEFSELDMPKILICHHPEYYEPYIKKLPVDMIVSGHAHGGQWRFFGHGLYAPGQGLLPKYTSGVYDGRFVVSRGLKRSPMLPRIFNPTEVVIVDIIK